MKIKAINVAAFVLLLLAFTHFKSNCQPGSLNNDKQVQKNVGLLELLPLVGVWESKGTELVTIETWKKLSDFTFECSSYQINTVTGDTISKECIILAEMNNEVFYIAKVSHNKMPIPFKYSGLKNSTYTFENPDHDYPKFISYKFESKDKLVVSIGKDKSIRYYYFNRVK